MGHNQQNPEREKLWTNLVSSTSKLQETNSGEGDGSGYIDFPPVGMHGSCLNPESTK